MTIKEMEGLECLLLHSRIDMNYGEGGSFNDNGEYDIKSVAIAKVGHKYIERILLKQQHKLAAKRINKAFASGKLQVDFPLTGPAADRKVVNGKVTYKA